MKCGTNLSSSPTPYHPSPKWRVSSIAGLVRCGAGPVWSSKPHINPVLINLHEIWPLRGVSLHRLASTALDFVRRTNSWFVYIFVIIWTNIRMDYLSHLLFFIPPNWNGITFHLFSYQWRLDRDSWMYNKCIVPATQQSETTHLYTYRRESIDTFKL